MDQWDMTHIKRLQKAKNHEGHDRLDSQALGKRHRAEKHQGKLSGGQKKLTVLCETTRLLTVVNRGPA